MDVTWRKENLSWARDWGTELRAQLEHCYFGYPFIAVRYDAVDRLQIGPILIFVNIACCIAIYKGFVTWIAVAMRNCRVSNLLASVAAVAFLLSPWAHNIDWLNVGGSDRLDTRLEVMIYAHRLGCMAAATSMFHFLESVRQLWANGSVPHEGPKWISYRYVAALSFLPVGAVVWLSVHRLVAALIPIDTDMDQTPLFLSFGYPVIVTQLSGEGPPSWSPFSMWGLVFNMATITLLCGVRSHIQSVLQTWFSPMCGLPVAGAIFFHIVTAYRTTSYSVSPEYAVNQMFVVVIDELCMAIILASFFCVGAPNAVDRTVLVQRD